MARKAEAGAVAIDPSTAAELEALTGTKGAASDSGAAAAGVPTLVTVLVGGKSYQVTPDVAQSIAEEQQSFHRERGRLAGELSQLRTRPPEKTTPTTEPSAPQKPPARLATEDYEEYERQMDAYRLHRELELERRIEEKAARREAEREKATRERTQLEIFISRVGKAHSALDGEENVILTAMNRLAKKYPDDPLPFADPRTLKLVTEEATAELARLAEKGKSLAPRVPHIEGQGGVGGVGAGVRLQERADEKGPISIAEIQRERKLHRLKSSRAGRGEE